MKRLEKGIESVIDKRIDKGLLLESSWIYPNCVTSTPTVDLGEKVYALTNEVSQQMREKYFS